MIDLKLIILTYISGEINYVMYNVHKLLTRSHGDGSQFVNVVNIKEKRCSHIWTFSMGFLPPNFKENAN